MFDLRTEKSQFLGRSDAICSSKNEMLFQSSRPAVLCFTFLHHVKTLMPDECVTLKGMKGTALISYD